MNVAQNSLTEVAALSGSADAQPISSRGADAYLGLREPAREQPELCDAEQIRQAFLIM
jgi:hypothetical protein